MVDLKTQLDSWLDFAFKKELTEVIKIKNLKQTINLITTKTRAAITELGLSDQDIVEIGYTIFALIFDTIDIPADRKTVMANTLRLRLKEALSQPFVPAPQEKPKFIPALKEVHPVEATQSPNLESNTEIGESLPPKEVFPTHVPKFMIREIDQPKPEDDPQNAPISDTPSEPLEEKSPSSSMGEKLEIREINESAPEDKTKLAPSNEIPKSAQGTKEIFEDVAEVKAPERKELRVKPAEALNLLGTAPMKKEAGVVDMRTLDMLKTVQITCHKCKWLYSSRNDVCPMCGASMILSEEDLIKFFLEYVDRQGIYLNKGDAINFMKEYKKTYKKLPDLKELWDTAEKIAKLEKMSENDLKKLQKDKRDKEKLDLKSEMERLKDKKLQERRAIEEEKRQKEEAEKLIKEAERKKKEAEIAAKAGGVPCPKCKTKNPPDSKFCLECGQILD